MQCKVRGQFEFNQNQSIFVTQHKMSSSTLELFHCTWMPKVHHNCIEKWNTAKKIFFVLKIFTVHTMLVLRHELPTRHCHTVWNAPPYPPPNRETATKCPKCSGSAAEVQCETVHSKKLVFTLEIFAVHTMLLPLLISTGFLKYPFRHSFQTGIKIQL